MNKKILLELIAVGVFCAVMVGAGVYTLSVSEQGRPTSVAVSDNLFGWKFPVTKFPLTGSEGSLAYSDIRDPGGIPEGLPVRLKIPIIGVNSAVEDALITPDGRMDVPAGSVNVAWFSLGPHPGEEGSAVIGGHFGISNGVPFVFYDLDKLRIGDKIYIEDDKGDTLAFVVRSVKLFKRDDDATDVFTSQDGLAHLNLITCEGIWNRVNDSYPERRVIFTDAIPAEGSAAATPASAVFPRPLDLGAEGPDVAALQTFLEEKGFLAIPPGIAKGFFGRLTSVAVAKYQTSVGLLPVGVFNSSTRIKLISEMTVAKAPSPATVKPALPPTALPTPQPQTLMESVKSLYATPLDIFITLLLLISTVFMIFKVIRR